MSFDLPALLSEYLLPLLLLVPLAIVVLLIAARSNKDDHWSHSRNDLLGPGTARAPLPTVRPDLPRTPMPSPYAVAPAPVPVAAPIPVMAPAKPPRASPGAGRARGGTNGGPSNPSGARCACCTRAA